MRPLEFDADTMRQMGYRVIDLLVDYWQSLPDHPIGRRADLANAGAAARRADPRRASTVRAGTGRVLQKVLPNIIKVDHPRYFAFVPAPNEYVGVLADLLSAGMNIFVGTWMVGCGRNAGGARGDSLAARLVRLA
jgi:aromatic-L-amino-acid/L-tryptophan decarboxylase